MKIASLVFRLGAVATTAGAAAILGRKAIDKQIEKKIHHEIERAKLEAEAELDRSFSAFAVERIVLFLRVMAAKLLCLGLVTALYGFGLLPLLGLRIALIGLAVLFIAYDLIRVLPHALPAWRYARKHSFRPKVMLTDFVAAIAFEEAYERAAVEIGSGPGRHWIKLSSFDGHALSSEIAEAVAEVARDASYRKVRWRAGLVLGLFAVLSFSYTALVFVTARL